MRKVPLSKITGGAISLLILGGVLASFAVYAQSAYETPRREGILEKRELIDRRWDEVKERVATKNAERKEQRIAHIKSVFRKILNRFEAALARLDKIVRKIERRIAKLKDKGVDTSAAEAALAGCSLKKSAAAAAIEDARARIAAIDSSSATVKEAVATSVDALRSAKRAIKDYHKCLTEVHRLLKAARGKEATESAE